MSTQVNQKMSMRLRSIDMKFSICKVREFRADDLAKPFAFAARTDEECSLVCPTEMVPEDAIARTDGWRALRVEGTLDFSLIGILAPIAQILADAKVGIFVVSTYNTDYVLVRETQLEHAVLVLADAGYQIE